MGNRDDHLRDHGLLRGAGGWQLAPAFDVNPNPEKDEHALLLDDSSVVPSVRTVHATCQLHRRTSGAASRIESHARAALADWRGAAAGLGIRRDELRRLDGIIEPELG